MSHARIEEVSDSDPEIDDPEDYLPSSDNQIIRPREQATSSKAEPNPTLFRPPPQSQSQPQQQIRTQADVERSRAAIKDYCMLHPCYFSSSRTKAQGRRVSKDLAIPNPLAYNLLMALKEVIQPDVNEIHIAFEPDKTHPKDWSNPGRARVQLFDKQTHKSLHPTIKDKGHLFVEVAKWLKAHPTKKEDTLELKIAGLPVPEKFLDTEVPIPKGWGTMNQILPLHSAAVSGGGVRDDFFKEALEEMRNAQGQGGAGGAGAGGMPDMASLQNMMQSMGGMGGMGGLGGMGGMGLPGLGGAGGGGGSSAGKKKDKRKG